MRGGDLSRLRVEDVCHGDQVAPRASVRQSKTQRPVTFEITPTTRKSVAAQIKAAGLKPGDYLFPSRVNKNGHLSTRQYSRIVKDWAKVIGEDPFTLWHACRADLARPHQDREHHEVPGCRTR